MEEIEIRKKFRENGFNDYTIELLIGVVRDFELVGFTKYLKIEDVVDRICNNLKHNIEFVKMDKKSTAGKYNYYEKKINISDEYIDDIKMIKSILFHEILHCITVFSFYDMIQIRISD